MGELHTEKPTASLHSGHLKSCVMGGNFSSRAEFTGYMLSNIAPCHTSPIRGSARMRALTSSVSSGMDLEGGGRGGRGRWAEGWRVGGWLGGGGGCVMVQVSTRISLKRRVREIHFAHSANIRDFFFFFFFLFFFPSLRRFPTCRWHYELKDHRDSADHLGSGPPTLS